MSYAKINTQIPHPQDLKLIREMDKVSPKSMQENQLPIVWNRAKDFMVYDRWGNKFIDFTSTIFVANSGHSNSDICNALKKQIDDELIHSYSFSNKIRLKYLKKLTKFTGFEKAFLLSAGTEATEAAVKIMRSSNEYRNPLQSKIILSIKGSMHGKTYLAEQLKDKGWDDRCCFIDNLSYPSEKDEFKYTLPPEYVCGVIIESYRGYDARFLPQNYVQSLVKWAKENNILVCFDEIQSGFGRTGKLFAYEWYDIPKPDLVCCGKGLGGGIPISAVLGSKELLDLPNDLSSTNSGNPLVCAGALANINYIEKHKLINNSLKLGGYLEERLVTMCLMNCIIEEGNCRGLVGALVFKNKEVADKVCNKCLKKGLLLVHTGRESIKIGPPLTITFDALKEGLDILEIVIRSINNGK
jgi:4-aminobutyrate aminotransferase-like enzyme